jgi:hypothetical protein
MRVAISLAALLLLLPSPAAADQIVDWFYLNSNLTFGFGNAVHSGYDGELDALNAFGGTFDALSGPFLDQTLVTDGSGTVIESKYFYEGGTFQADFTWQSGGGSKTGSFVAPIITLEIDVLEDHDHAYAYYLLGPGLFDASLADALGVRRPTVGGNVFSDMLLMEDTGGDYTSPERQAWDGFTYVTVNVPEPPMPILGVLGLGAAWLCRRRALAN